MKDAGRAGVSMERHLTTRFSRGGSMITQAVLHNGTAPQRIIRSSDHQRLPGVIALVDSSAPKMAPIKFDRNASIYRVGDPVGRLYKVVVGAVRVCRVLADGRRQIGAFYLPGDMFGLETEAE